MEASKILTKTFDFSSISTSFFSQKTSFRYMILPSQKSKKDNTSMIYVELTFTTKADGRVTHKQKRFPTEVRVEPEYWSRSKERVKPKHTNHVDLNDQLNQLEHQVKEFITPTGPYRQSLPIQLKGIEQHFERKNRKTLIEYLSLYIAIRQKDSTRGTWKEFITLRGRLERYEVSRSKTLYFENVNHGFAEDFKEWAKLPDVTLDPNSIKKSFEIMTTFLNHYYDDQHKLSFHLSDDFRNKKFKHVSGTHDSDPVPLYPDELRKLIDYKFDKDIIFLNDKGEKEKLSVATGNKIKKLFLLSCFTGLRYSDVIRLSRGNIQNDTIIIRAKKTDKKNVGDLHIPLLEPVKKILESIHYDIKKIILSNQKSNKYIKVLLKEIGINDMVKVYEYSLNGDRTEDDKPKSEIVTFHCGRDTFITNCLISDAEIMTVMSWSGHRKFDTFRKYVKLSESYKKVQHKKADKFFAFANQSAEEIKNIVNQLPVNEQEMAKLLEVQGRKYTVDGSKIIPI